MKSPSSSIRKEPLVPGPDGLVPAAESIGPKRIEQMLRPVQEVHPRRDTFRGQGVDRSAALLPRDHIVRRAVDDVGGRAVTSTQYLRIRAHGSHTLRVRHLHVRPRLQVFACADGIPLTWEAVEEEWKRLRLPVHV